MRREDALNLAGQGSCYRQDRYRKYRLNYDNGAAFVIGYYSPVTSERKIESAGYLNPYDATIRIAKTEPIKPLLGKTIRITYDDGTIAILRIEKNLAHDLAQEWVLGCKAVL